MLSPLARWSPFAVVIALSRSIVSNFEPHSFHDDSIHSPDVPIKLRNHTEVRSRLQFQVRSRTSKDERSRAGPDPRRAILRAQVVRPTGDRVRLVAVVLSTPSALSAADPRCLQLVCRLDRSSVSCGGVWRCDAMRSARRPFAHAELTRRRCDATAESPHRTSHRHASHSHRSATRRRHQHRINTRHQRRTPIDHRHDRRTRCTTAAAPRRDRADPRSVGHVRIDSADVNFESDRRIEYRRPALTRIHRRPAGVAEGRDAIHCVTSVEQRWAAAAGDAISLCHLCHPHQPMRRSCVSSALTSSVVHDRLSVMCCWCWSGGVAAEQITTLTPEALLARLRNIRELISQRFDSLDPSQQSRLQAGHDRLLALIDQAITRLEQVVAGKTEPTEPAATTMATIAEALSAQGYNDAIDLLTFSSDSPSAVDFYTDSEMSAEVGFTSHQAPPIPGQIPNITNIPIDIIDITPESLLLKLRSVREFITQRFTTLDPAQQTRLQKGYDLLLELIDQAITRLEQIVAGKVEPTAPTTPTGPTAPTGPTIPNIPPIPNIPIPTIPIPNIPKKSTAPTVPAAATLATIADTLSAQGHADAIELLTAAESDFLTAQREERVDRRRPRRGGDRDRRDPSRRRRSRRDDRDTRTRRQPRRGSDDRRERLPGQRDSKSLRERGKGGLQQLKRLISDNEQETLSTQGQSEQQAEAVKMMM
jgi:hypothetical protein